MKKAVSPHQPTDNLVADLFDMGPDYYGFRPHGSGDWLLIATLHGAGEIGTPDGTFTLEAGQAVLYHPNAYQYYRTSPEASHWALQWSHFQPHSQWLPLLNWPQALPGVGRLDLRHGPVRQQVETAMHDLAHWHNAADALAAELAANALERVLLLCACNRQDLESVTHDSRITRVIYHIREHLSETHSVDSLARIASLSASRLSHLFKEVTGITPQQYLEQERMRRARNLLRHSNLRVGEIATQVGFENTYYFSTRFKHRHGQSPREYRFSDVPPVGHGEHD